MVETCHHHLAEAHHRQSSSAGERSGNVLATVGLPTAKCQMPSVTNSQQLTNSRRRLGTYRRRGNLKCCRLSFSKKFLSGSLDCGA